MALHSTYPELAASVMLMEWMRILLASSCRSLTCCSEREYPHDIWSVCVSVFVWTVVQ